MADVFPTALLHNEIMAQGLKNRSTCSHDDVCNCLDKKNVIDELGRRIGMRLDELLVDRAVGSNDCVRGLVWLTTSRQSRTIAEQQVWNKHKLGCTRECRQVRVACFIRTFSTRRR